MQEKKVYSTFWVMGGGGDAWGCLKLISWEKKISENLGIVIAGSSSLKLTKIPAKMIIFEQVCSIYLK